MLEESYSLASEYIAPLVSLLGIAFYFLYIAMNLERKEEVNNSRWSVFDFIDIARFVLIAVSLGFGLLALNLGREIVNNNTTNMITIFNTTTTVYLGAAGLMLLGLLVYIFFIIPSFIKKAVDKKESEE